MHMYIHIYEWVGILDTNAYANVHTYVQLCGAEVWRIIKTITNKL